MPATRRPCAGKPGFLEPADAPANWHEQPDAVAAQTMCGHCPFTTECAREALGEWTPDGVIQAGVVCRGDDDTRAQLEQAAGIAAPADETDAVIVDLDAHRNEHCTKCDRRMVPRNAIRGPGEAFRGARGYCHTCHGEARRAGNLRRAEKPERSCEQCGIPMVPKGNTPPPGKSEHRGRGLCADDYNQWRRERHAA